jgi:capsular polysaccharide transport system permease protein
MSAESPRLNAPAAGIGQGGGHHRYGAFVASLMEHYARTLFVLVFLLPTLIAALYYGFVASDRYVSETHFIVRSISKPASEGASAYLQDFGILRANDDAFAIQDYVHSRDAMQAIMRRIDLRQVWTRDGADFWSRYGTLQLSDNDEALFKYYQRHVEVEKNLETGITAIKVTAYRAADAQAIARMILALSEARINDMNLRARRDAVSTAEEARAESARGLAQATVALTRYRDASQQIDPALSADASIERSSALDQELAQLQISLQTMLSRAPNNPALPALRQRIVALSAQVAAQKGELTGGDQSLSTKLGDYERLVVERELAEKTYEAAQKQLDSAHEQAQRQQVYIESVALPNLPDKAQEPRRLRYVFTVALLSFWAFLIFYLLLSGGREHLNVS